MQLFNMGRISRHLVRLCKTSARYISHVLSVYRVRPRDPNDEARSTEDFGEEEVVFTEEVWTKQ